MIGQRFSALFTPQFRNFDRRAGWPARPRPRSVARGSARAGEMTSTRPRHGLLGDAREIGSRSYRRSGRSRRRRRRPERDRLNLHGHRTRRTRGSRGVGPLRRGRPRRRLRRARRALRRRRTCRASARASAVLADFRRGFAARDWDGAARRYGARRSSADHRLVGWGTMSGQGALVRALEGSSDSRRTRSCRSTTSAPARAGFLWTATWQGTRDGGAYETPWIMVIELDAQGRETRLDVWDIEQLDVARARFDEIAAIAPGDPRAAIAKPNLATASAEPLNSAFGERDLDAALQALDAVHPHYAPDFVWEDRRPIVGTLRRSRTDARLGARAARFGRPARAPHDRRRCGRPDLRRARSLGGRAAGGALRSRVPGAERGQRGRPRHRDDPVRSRRYARRAARGVGALGGDRSGRGAGRGASQRAHRCVERTRSRAAPRTFRGRRRRRGSPPRGARAHRRRRRVRRSQRRALGARAAAAIEFGWSWPAVDRHGAVVTLRREGTLPDGDAFENDYVWLCLPRMAASRTSSSSRATHSMPRSRASSSCAPIRFGFRRTRRRKRWARSHA